MPRLQRIGSGLCVVSLLIGPVGCGDDDPTDVDSIVGDSAGRGGRTSSAGRGGGGEGAAGGDEEGAGAGGRSSARDGSGGSTSVVPDGSDGTAGGGASHMSAPGAGGAHGTADVDAGVRLSDAEIVAVTSVVNASEIEAGNTALERAEEAPTRAFAQNMVSMHTMAQERQTALAMSLNLTPAENPISTMLREQAEETRTRLMQASDEEFDLIYAEAQVAAHSMVLTLIDDVLLPSATNELLRAELTTTRTTVTSHLEMAKDLVATLRDTGGARAAR